MHFIDIHYTCLFCNSRIGIENHCAHHKELAIHPVDLKYFAQTRGVFVTF